MLQETVNELFRRERAVFELMSFGTTILESDPGRFHAASVHAVLDAFLPCDAITNWLIEFGDERQLHQHSAVMLKDARHRHDSQCVK